MSWRYAFSDCGVASSQQLLALISRKQLRTLVLRGQLIRVQHGIYAAAAPDHLSRLAAIDLRTGERTVACMNTAAALYGFDTDPDGLMHILDPGVRIRPTAEVMVHQRLGAPLRVVGHRLATAPAWTAVEMARTLRRPRALAILDAALGSGLCTAAELTPAVAEQKGRRGIVTVRDLLGHADGRAESPMESEARLVFIDGGLPLPELQFEIIDRQGKLWRVDFAWPAFGVVAEYESMQWHATAEALKHDRMKVARLQELGLATVPLVVDDVRKRPQELVTRMETLFERAALARARKLLDDGDRLPGALAHGFTHLLLIFRGDVLGEHVQVVIVVEVEHLRDDAHADAVALAEAEIHFDLAHDGSLRTGTCEYPATFCM